VPTYDYRCETNGQVLEVKHHMNERLATWGIMRVRRIEPGVHHGCCVKIGEGR
jgi:hypothetical protein